MGNLSLDLGGALYMLARLLPYQVFCDIQIVSSCLQHQEQSSIFAVDSDMPVESVLQLCSVEVPKPLTELYVWEENELILRAAPESNVAIFRSLQKLLLMGMESEPVTVVSRLGVFSGYRT